MRLGDEEFHAGPGDVIHTPPDIAHAFVVTGTEPTRLIGMDWPGGFHHLYGELAELAGADHSACEQNKNNDDNGGAEWCDSRLARS